MAKKIDPSLRKVGEYLKIDKSAKFIIPEYQRAYSWKIENCDILWQDINNFIDSVTNDCYFFGTIIISCSNDDSCLSLIDGQQRTTTFLLLLKALLNKINVEIPKTKGDDDAFKLYSALKERRKDIIEIIYRCDREDISEEFSSVEDSIIYDRFTMVENKSINERFKNDLNIILNSIDLKMAESKITIIPFKKNDNKYSAFFRNYKYFCEKVDEMNVSQLNQFAKKFIKECEIIEI